MKFKFIFNAAARKEAIAALQHLRNKGSPLTVLAGLLLNSLGDRIAIALGALIVYVVCTVGIIYIRGLETKVVKRKTEKDKTKPSINDTS